MILSSPLAQFVSAGWILCVHEQTLAWGSEVILSGWIQQSSRVLVIAAMSCHCTSFSPPVLNRLPKKTSVSFSSYHKPSCPLQVFRTPSRPPFLENVIVGFNLIWKSIWEEDFHSLCSLALEAIPARPRMLAEPNVINSKRKKAGVRCHDGSGWGEWETDERGRTDQSGSSVSISLPSTLHYWVSNLRCLLRPAGAAVK